jgi:hypothetical protein
MIKKITLTGMLAVLMFCSFAKGFKQEAISYLQKNKAELKLSDQDIADLVVVEDVLDDYTNINRVWLQQTAKGLPLINGLISVHIKDGKVVNSTNSGVFDLNKQVATSNPSLSAATAVARAASYTDAKNIGTISLQEKVDKKNQLYIFKPVTGLSNIEIHAQLALVMDKYKKVHLAWIVQFHSLDNNHFWCIEVDAASGALISKSDQIIHCSFGTGKYLQAQDHHGHVHNSATSWIETPEVPSGVDNDVEGPQAGSYRVYRYNVESAIYGTRTLISNPDDAVASPYGWHDVNGIAGPDSLNTKGNNVYAYADKDGNNVPDPNSSPNGTASLNFDFPLDFSTKLDTFNASGTLTNSKAIVTQLFYMNNVIHDIMYKHGFTDANRNFQVKNYVSGNTATDGDPVYAEAHDGTKDPETGATLKNNANFATAPDGTNTNFSRSRMQMFMWDGAGPVSLTYNAPAPIAGDIDSFGVQSGWGPCNFNVTGEVANATSATAPSSFVCGAVNNASSIAGKIALIDRGGCDFSAKVFNAQTAGAIGVIIINRESAGDSLLNMSGGLNAALVTIPAVVVKYTDGQKLRNNLATANVTLFRQSPSNCLEYDASLDNGIVGHEYGHGISIRLTGTGPQANGSNCLRNAEQAGEGWSDFFALALTQKATDTKNTPRGIGNYVIGEPTTGLGIRRYPYCYDMSVNPQTYGDLNEEEDIYLNGEVWASALWDMYWELVEAHGYTADLYNGTGGNVRALKLVIEGLKQQPCNPGLLDGRNAILKADSILYNKANTCLIWKAFSRRGMGASALQGSSLIAIDQTEAFNLPAFCNTTPTATASFTASDTTVCVGGSLTFTNTSTASSGSPDSVKWTIPGGVPGTSTSTTTVTPTFSTAGTYVVSLIAYKSGNASVAATKSIRVKPLPTLSVTSPAICSGNTAQPIASGNSTSYSWTGGLAAVANPTTGVLTTTTTYTVTGTRELCTATAVSTVTVNAAPTVSVNSPTICSGTTADLTVTGTATTFAWTGGLASTATPTTPVLTTTTTYTVTGTLGTCSKTAVATVTVTALPNVTVNSPSICSGATATLTATNATSYTWSPNIGGTASVTTPALTTTTTYTVTGTANGCTKSAVATVTVTAPPVVTVNSPSICSGTTATLIADGATTYSWSPNIGSTASVTTPVLTTTTTYTVTGTTGCTATAVATVTVNPSPTVNVTSPSICSGNTAQPVASGTATSYSWTGGLASTSNPTTPSLTTTTTYTVTGTLGSCTKTAVATVTVNALPNVTVTSPGICSGGTATLQASGATSYTWTGGLASTANPTTPPLTTTTTYTVTGSDGSCSKTAVATVTVASSLSVTVNAPSICSGTTASLQANGATTYTWTGGLASTATPTTPALTTTTTYTVTGTSGSCTGTAVATVTVNALPNVTVNSPAICSGQTADISANGATSYTWTGGLASTATPTTPALTTTTTYTVTGTSGSCSKTAVATVTVTALPNVTVNSPAICSGQTADLIANGATSYTWTGGLASTATPTTTALTTTTTYTVTGSNGSCSGTAVSTVTVNPTPVTPGITQSGDTLYSSTIIVGATYQWFKSGLLQGTTTTPYFNLTSSGSYTVKVVNGTCTSAESVAFAAVYTSIRNNSNSIKVFEVYPNPTEGQLVMNLSLTKSSTVQIRIYTPEGRELYVKSFSSTRNVFEELNISDYAKGVYIIKLTVDEEVYYHKVVRQ